MAWVAADAKGIYDGDGTGGPSTSELATGSTEQHGVNVALSRLIWVEHEVESFFEANGFIGAEKDMSKIIWKKVDLVKGRGETIYMLMRAKLTDSTGITGDSVLFGNEESLSYGYQSITINQLRHAVALDGAMTEKRFIGDLRKDAKDALKVWLAEMLDSNLFTTLAASLSRVLYPGLASSTATLSEVDKMDLATVAKARALAIKKRIKGIKYKGKMYYVLIMSPDQAYDLQTNAAEAGFSWETLQKDAAARGDGNRLFTGALGLYMGVLLYSHESIPTATTWGSGSDVNGATALFLGAAAGCRAFGGYVDTGAPVKAVEEKHDYGNVFATAIGTIYGDKKTNYTLSGSSSPLFNEDYAVIGIRTARTNITEGT